MQLNKMGPEWQQYSTKTELIKHILGLLRDQCTYVIREVHAVWL